MTHTELKSKMTIKEAAELLGYSNKSTLMKDKRAGKFSVETDEAGVLLVDASELQRVYPTRYKNGLKRMSKASESTGSQSSDLTHQHPSDDPDWTPEKSNDPNVLRYFLEQKSKELEDVKKKLDEKDGQIEMKDETLKEKDEMIKDLVNNIQQLALPAPGTKEKRKLTFRERLTGKLINNDKADNASQSLKTAQTSS